MIYRTISEKAPSYRGMESSRLLLDKFVANEDGKTLTMTYYYKLDKPEMEPESVPESTSETIYTKVSD